MSPNDGVDLIPLRLDELPTRTHSFEATPAQSQAVTRPALSGQCSHSYRYTFVYLRLLETTFAARREIRSICLVAEPAGSEFVRTEIVDGHERNL